MKNDIKSLLPEELEAALLELGEPKYRVKQVFTWLHRGVTSFDGMSNLPKPLRDKLSEHFFINDLTELQRQTSAEDGTVKQLWGLRDGNSIETVLMRYSYGNTLCISTQVGCRMGCAFCASTLGGLVRNLHPAEMLDELLCVERENGLTVSHIVLMGIGEPLDNFDNVVRFLRLVNYPDGRNIGMRHISLSTCGVVPMLDKLSELDMQLTLSVSLHAPDDETRQKLMPIDRRYGVESLMAACGRYFKKTGRRISFEYAMIDGVNDSERHADMLAERAKRVGAHVNLIPLNYVAERGMKPTPDSRIRAFTERLRKNGVNVTVRRRLGSDVDASCGQLRRRQAKDELGGQT